MRRGLCLSYSLTPRWDFSKTCVHSKFKAADDRNGGELHHGLAQEGGFDSDQIILIRLAAPIPFATVISMPIEIVLDR